ncbi:MAG: hypothetical protein AB1656_10735 [Candidatus Omnitrophota bacterium]
MRRMKKSKIVGSLWMGLVMVGCGILAGASIPSAAYSVEIGGEEVGITVDFTYATKYIWRGYDVFYDDRPLFQPSVVIDWRGFSAGFYGLLSDGAEGDDGVEHFELDFGLGYERSFWEEERYALDISLDYTYFAYPNHHRSEVDGEEIALAVSMPNLIPLGPSILVPSYEMAYEWHGLEGGTNFDEGFIHTLGLSYAIPIPVLIPAQEEQAIDLSWNIAYNSGCYETDSSWTHTTIGASTTFEYGQFYFTPALYYQWSFEDTMNEEDEFYASFSAGFLF